MMYATDPTTVLEIDAILTEDNKHRSTMKIGTTNVVNIFKPPHTILPTP